MSGQAFPDPDLYSRIHFQKLMDVQRDVVDGHLHFQDEVVAFLLDKDGKELLVDVIEEELKVRATVPSATSCELV